MFDELKSWWSDPVPAAWETYETTIGRTYDTAEEAGDVIPSSQRRNLIFAGTRLAVQTYGGLWPDEAASRPMSRSGAFLHPGTLTATRVQRGGPAFSRPPNQSARPLSSRPLPLTPIPASRAPAAMALPGFGEASADEDSSDVTASDGQGQRTAGHSCIRSALGPVGRRRAPAPAPHLRRPAAAAWLLRRTCARARRRRESRSPERFNRTRR